KKRFLCLEGFELAVVYITVEARFATRGHLSAASRVTGPLISVPFFSPSGVIRTPSLSSKECLFHSGLRSAGTCLNTNDVYTSILSITTNETSLLSGLHSAMVTRSPVVAAMHGGLWARVLLLRLSYLLYFG